LQGSPNFTQIGIFGLKINHLATLIPFQEEINVLRQRAALIEKVGESIPLQQPNQVSIL
jgi:hypothetical protein